MTSALNKKLWRDLWRMRGQVLAIGLIMASGIGVLVMGLSTVEALDETARAYYERYRFAHVFANVKRAPTRLLADIAALPGVQSVEGRVVEYAIVDIDGFAEPVVGQLVSLPARVPQRLNLLTLRSGRLPATHADDEVVISEPFARAHSLYAGDTIKAVLNGTWRELRIVGTALSPEFVYAIGPGALMPDDRRFGVLWLPELALQAAFDLEGAFNEVSVSLLRGARAQDAIDGMDRILDRYGGVGAYERADQLSNWFLMNEIKQLGTLSRILPTVFLAVAAFLTNMVLARLIALERSEIGLLKAFGYTRRQVAWHYAKFVLAIGAFGIALGWLAGYWLGWYETRLYGEFFHFPFLLYRPAPTSFVIAAVIGFGAALLGALRTVFTAAALPPAEAMRPPAPPMFQRVGIVGLGFAQRLEQLTRIIIRQVWRWPMRTLTTCGGIAMATAVLLASFQWLDAINNIVDVYFRQAQSQDVTVIFAEPRSIEVARSMARLPGVRTVEPMRVVPAKMRFGWREQRESLQALPMNQALYRVYDANGKTLSLPLEGLMISSMLAEILHVGIGDEITVEILEGRREVLRIPVAAIFETYIGSPAYIEEHALARLLRESQTVSAMHLRVDSLQLPALLEELKTLPRLSAVSLRAANIQIFDETMARTLMIFVSFFIMFSCALSIGVTYNAARISLSERGREFATLRVLGFTRGEISYLLLGEIALLAAIALPLGCLLGHLLAKLIVTAFKTELFRVPFVLDGSSYGWAMIITVASTALSAVLVRRRLDRLDLIAVLKTRE
ncbi:MAG TPA: FtsX-like permease family protein [Steroidobacter sp.]|uniref:ABC transporter permease n=1 Tax=Steroidobacter sp. TaxID=1978227 RepID=UPI002EDAA32A